MSLPSALKREAEIVERIEGKRVALFLDYDGTLTPIVAHPEDATLSDAMREVLRELASRCTVAIVSGRDRADVEGLVDLRELVYAGSHGFDIAGPGGMHFEHEGGRACLPDLDAAERELHERLDAIQGVQIERKRFAIAVHHRNVADSEVARVERAFEEVHRAHARLRREGGKKVFELQPAIDWDKGEAVLWLLDRLGLDTPDVVPIYIGDDLTDENAFRALRSRGIGVLVGEPKRATEAHFFLCNTEEVREFLSDLAGALDQRRR